jgi:hypothetical protein
VLLEGFVQEKMARHGIDSAQQRFVADAPAAQSVHHTFAKAFVAIGVGQKVMSYG